MKKKNVRNKNASEIVRARLNHINQSKGKIRRGTYTMRVRRIDGGGDVDHSKEPYYWVVGQYNGRDVLLGAFTTKEAADNKGMQVFSGIYSVEVYYTKDINKASQMHKAARGEEISLEDRMQRVKRKI